MTSHTPPPTPMVDYLNEQKVRIVDVEAPISGWHLSVEARCGAALFDATLTDVNGETPYRCALYPSPERVIELATDFLRSNAGDETAAVAIKASALAELK
jgi:hypothetical protein